MATRKRKPRNPITPEASAKFDGFMAYWQEKLNLMDWRYVRALEPSEDMAEITEQHSDHRMVLWKLGTDFGSTPVTDETLSKVALHENLHVLLHRLVEVCCHEREMNDKTIEEEHRVIAILERLLQNLCPQLRTTSPATPSSPEPAPKPSGTTTT